MSKKIELHLTMEQLRRLNDCLWSYGHGDFLQNIRKIILEKIEMNTEPEENNNDVEE